MPAAAAKIGFWVAMPTDTGEKSSFEVQLYPAPTRVDYPTTELGEQVETADGRVVVQMPSRDPRRRTWIWSNFGPDARRYEQQYRWLESLRSRSLQAKGIGPYVYLYDGMTRLMDRSFTATMVVSGVSGQILTVPDFTDDVHPTTLKYAVVDALLANGTWARRSVNYATATTLVIDEELPSALHASNEVIVSWLAPDWWRVRVLDTTRVLRGDGGSVRYSESKLVFVVEDAATNAIPPVGDFGLILGDGEGGNLDLSYFADGTILMVEGGELIGATEDEDYLDPDSPIEGGSYIGS